MGLLALGATNAFTVPAALAQETGLGTPAPATEAVAAGRRSILPLLSIILGGPTAAPGAGTPPALAGIPDQSFTLNAPVVPLSLSGFATPTDGDPITGWAVATGSLPTGLSLNTTSGVISGTPTTVGTFNFTVTASDKDGASAAQAVKIAVIAPGPSSYQLIDLAVGNGSLSQEQALIYKAYVDFNYPGLPAQYKGNDNGAVPDAQSQIMAYLDQGGSLSQAALDALHPFFVPAYFQGSWWQRRLDTLAGGMPALSSTVPASSPYCNAWNAACGVLGNWKAVVGTKVAVWYLAAYEATDQPKAVVLLNEFERSSGIWDRLTALMGRTPIADTGSFGLMSKTDGILDVVLVDTMGPKGEGTTYTSSMTVCRAQPAYIYLNRNLAIDGLFANAAHEFMHAIQFSYNSIGCPTDYYTIKEATAVWATHYMYPQGIFGTRWETRYAPNYLGQPNKAFDQNPGDDLFRYGAYLFPLYLENRFGAAVVKEIWDKTTSSASELRAINSALVDNHSKTLDEVWPQFAAANYSQNDPANYALTLQALKTSDLTKLAEDYTDASNFTGTAWVPFSVNLPHTSASYHRMTFSRLDTRNLMIVNGISYKATAESYPGYNGSVVYGSFLTDDERRGASVQLLYKINGNWLSGTVNLTNVQLPMLVCRDDPATLVDEIVFIYSNGEFDPAKPNYSTLAPRGISPGMHITNIGCRAWTGTFNLVNNVGPGSVQETLTGTITAKPVQFAPSITPAPDPGPYDKSVDHISMSGGTYIYAESGAFHWSRSGTYFSSSKTCIQSGTLDYGPIAMHPVGGFGDMVLSGASDHVAHILTPGDTCSSPVGCWAAAFDDSCSLYNPTTSTDFTSMMVMTLPNGSTHLSADGLSVTGTGAETLNPPKVTGTWSFTAQTR
jgi:hypothetical protein